MMVDLCSLNSSKCLNNGKCIVNIPLNSTYCQCDPCHEGFSCENVVWKQTQVDTTRIYIVIFVIGLCVSVLNNTLIIELFICCRRIRRTNCGIYLIVYSILSFLSSIFLLTDRAMNYLPNQLITSAQLQVANCYIGRIGYTMLIYLCIWFSSCVAFERGLVICFDGKMNANRWRSVVITIVVFIIASGSATPMFLYQCNWDTVPNLKTARAFSIWFYIIAGIATYVLATLLVLISFARRIRRYRTQNLSFIKTFLKLLYTHLFIFIPPIAYIVSYIPYTITTNLQNPKHSYLQCGISTGEYIIKVLMKTLIGVPFVITWLLFVYPSRVYMTEFYLNTWSGQCVARIIFLCKSYKDRGQSDHPSTMNLTNNEPNNRQLTV